MSTPAPATAAPRPPTTNQRMAMLKGLKGFSVFRVMGFVSWPQRLLVVAGLVTSGLVELLGLTMVAPILAQMNPVRAKQVTTELAKRRKPGDPPEAAPATQARAAGG